MESNGEQIGSHDNTNVGLLEKESAPTEDIGIESVQKQKELLSDRDREFIYNGLHVLTDHLLEIKPDKLPRVLIYPDVSARVLSYAVRPVVEKIYGLKHAEVPQVVFMQTSSRKTLGLQEHYRQILSKNPFVRLLNGAYSAEGKAYAKEKLQEGENARAIISERAEEVIDKTHLRAGDHVLIIDDYINSQYGTTITEIKRGITGAQQGIHEVELSPI